MEGSVYLKARQEWDERYADLVLGKRNWQITAAGMMAITLVVAFGMVWVSTRSKFVPYVVEVDKLGYAIGAPMQKFNAIRQIAEGCNRLLFVLEQRRELRASDCLEASSTSRRRKPLDSRSLPVRSQPRRIEKLNPFQRTAPLLNN